MSSKLTPQTNWKVDTAAVAEGQWPPGARLVLPASGKPSDLGLRHQHPLIQSIICKAIQKVTDEMVLKQAWPKAKERLLYKKTILLDACREITEECDDSDCHDIKAVKRRIKKEASFAKALANVVCILPLFKSENKPLTSLGDRLALNTPRPRQT